MKNQFSGIIILDFGSQYTQLIKRRLDEYSIEARVIENFSEVSACSGMRGIILSGSPDHLEIGESFRVFPDWLDLTKIPVLGICYGMHLIVDFFGGEVRSSTHREYGKAIIEWDLKHKKRSQELFDCDGKEKKVWMSHGDSVERLPSDFVSLARSEALISSVIAHKNLPILGFQFHPEVYHCEAGARLLKDFAVKVCQLTPGFCEENDVDYFVRKIQKTVGSQRVLVGASGGVDSSVLCKLLFLALEPKQVSAVFVDHGFMRKNESANVLENFKKNGMKIDLLDESERFFFHLKNISDPEQKRKIIGSLFVDSFQDYARSKGNFSFLAQGTLYPDVVESSEGGSQKKVIKSHHNVGGLSKALSLKLIEPFRMMFKDQVRSLGRKMFLSEEMISRHPFPGPGLAIRIVGAVSQEKVKILRDADDIYMKALKDSGYYHKIWQAGAILLPVKSVGIMGDERSYEWTCVLRAVHGADGMTAQVSSLPTDLLCDIARDIVQKVHRINRVLYDITTKPPATIEWE